MSKQRRRLQPGTTDVATRDAGGNIRPLSAMVPDIAAAIRSVGDGSMSPEAQRFVLAGVLQRIAREQGEVSGLQSGEDIAVEDIEWLWPHWLPTGKLSLIVGPVGQGKSMVTLDLAARLGTGRPWPDGAPAFAVSPTIILNAEDTPADTIIPRVMAAGGDRTRTKILTAATDKGTKRPFSLARDLPELRYHISMTGARLVVIDPLSAYLGGADSWKDASIRDLLTPLAEIARETGSAILGVMHPNKAQQMKAVQRISGSIAFGAAPRSILTLVPDPEDDHRKLLGQIKSSVGVIQKARPFTIVQRRVAGLKQPVGAIEWASEASEVDVAAVMEQGATQGDPLEKKKATALVEELFKDTDAVPAQTLKRQADARGISRQTLNRACHRHKLKTAKVGDHWWWMRATVDPRQLSTRTHGNMGS